MLFRSAPEGHEDRKEGDNEGEWVLMDFGDLIVHLMLPATRECYDLEGLWNERLGIRVSQAREQVEG